MNTEEFIAECEKFRPHLRQEQPHEMFVTIFGMWKLFNSIAKGKKGKWIMPETLADALATLMPVESREFWLRCEATFRERFIGGMTALMTGPREDE